MTGNTVPQSESVVFDVGWVLVRLDYTPFLDYLATSGQRYDIKEVIAATRADVPPVDHELLGGQS